MMSVEFVATNFLIMWTLAVSWASIQSIETTFTKGKMVATSHTTIQPFSKIQCVEKCNKESMRNSCSIAGYDKALNACYLSVDNPENVITVANDNVGVFFFQQVCAAEGDHLINGTTPVPDSYMTASSEYSTWYKPYHARLHNEPNGSHYGAWCNSPADAATNASYIQVRFWKPSTVASVAIQGGSSIDVTYWTTSYRLEFSDDCAAFQPLLNSTGQNQVFPGNTDQTSVVINPLTTPISALCMRLFPLAWTWTGSSCACLILVSDLSYNST